MRRTVGVLVCGNGGAVGRELLRRPELDLHWALTVAEAMAVIDRIRPKAVLARESIARDLLEALPKNRVPIVVLLETDGWDRRDEYFVAGATALVQATAAERILEALSTLTGLTFSRNPRADVESVVEVFVQGEDRLLETVNVSTSGVCIKGFPQTGIGAGTTVRFVMEDPPFEVPAVVVRCFVHAGLEAAGLAFVDPTAQVSMRLQAMVDAVIARSDRPTIPVELPDELLQTMTGLPVVPDDVREALTRRIAGSGSVPLPEWMERAAGDLTKVERDALRGKDVPKWANAAVDLRISLCRTRSVVKGNLPSGVVEKALGACKALAQRAENEPPEILCQVTRVRASILRELYSTDKTPRIGAIEGPLEK